MVAVGGRDGRVWRAWVGGSVVLLALVSVVAPRAYYKVYLDSKGAIALCSPVRVYLPDIHLRLPKIYCAHMCDTSVVTCMAFRYIDSECHLYSLFITSGYSMTAKDPNALPFYHALDYKHYYPFPDLALHATVTASSNYWSSPTFEKHLTNGALCTRRLCPCTTVIADSVIVDLGALHYVKEIRILLSYPPDIYSQNFAIYLGDATNKISKHYICGAFNDAVDTCLVYPKAEIQFITFRKADNRLCLCFVQVFG